MSLLVTPRGDPAPPQEIVRRLQQIEPRLGLKFASGYWALTLQWSDEDPRRQTVRSGEIGEDSACDMLCGLPLDCSVDAAHTYFVNACKTGYGGHNKEDVRKLLEGIHRWNAEQSERNASDTYDYAAELIETNACTLFRDEGKTIPKVYMTEPAPSNKRKRVKEL